MKRLNFLNNKKNKYSIRRFTVGTASILIGALLFWGQPTDEVQAEEINNDSTGFLEQKKNQLVDEEESQINNTENLNNEQVQEDKNDSTTVEDTTEEVTTENTKEDTTENEENVKTETNSNKDDATEEQNLEDTTESNIEPEDSENVKPNNEQPENNEEQVDSDGSSNAVTQQSKESSENEANSKESEISNSIVESPETNKQQVEPEANNDSNAESRDVDKSSTETVSTEEKNNEADDNLVTETKINSTSADTVDQVIKDTDLTTEEKETIKKDLPANINELSEEEIEAEIIYSALKNREDSKLPETTTSSLVNTNTRLRSFSRLATTTTSTNVNNLVTASNLSTVNKNPDGSTATVKPTYGGYIVLKGNFTVDDKVKAGDTFTVDFGKYIVPGALYQEDGRPAPTIQTATGETIAVGKVNNTTNSYEYIFTDYVNNHNNVKGSFEFVISPNRTTAPSNGTYTNTISFAGEQFNHNYTVDYKNYIDDTYITRSAITSFSPIDGKYTRVSYVNPQLSGLGTGKFTATLTQTNATLENVKIYKVPSNMQNAFTDSFVPNLTGLQDITSQVTRINADANTTLLQFTTANNRQNTGYIIITEGTGVKDGNIVLTTLAGKSVSNTISWARSSATGTGDFSSVSESASISTSESLSSSKSLSTSESMSASKSLSTSESMSASKSLSTSESMSASKSLSTSESMSASKSLSTSESMSASKSLSTSESMSTSQSLSASESLSTSQSLSASESLSTSESLSESESISTSESLSESESISTS
ncbi:Ig-like domain-containing protein, partial [Staphylococcus shinii]